MLLRTVRGIFNKVITNRLIAWKAREDFSIPKQWDVQHTQTISHWSGKCPYLYPSPLITSTLNSKGNQWEDLLLRQVSRVRHCDHAYNPAGIYSNNYIISNATGILFKAALWYREGNKTLYRTWVWGIPTDLLLLGLTQYQRFLH